MEVLCYTQPAFLALTCEPQFPLREPADIEDNQEIALVVILQPVDKKIVLVIGIMRFIVKTSHCNWQHHYSLSTASIKRVSSYGRRQQ